MTSDKRIAGAGDADTAQILLLVRVYQDPEDGLHYVDSPHLDIVRAGRTPEEAYTVFAEAVRILVDGWRERNGLAQRLDEIGFRAIAVPGAGGRTSLLYCPPELDILPQDLEEDYARFKGSKVQAIPFEVGSGTLCRA